MNEKFDIITFGSAVVDFFLCSDQFQLKEDSQQNKIICQPYQDKINVSQRKICLGGGGANTAVSLSRKGFNTALVARFGQDFLGDFIINKLKQEQVNLDFLNREDKDSDSSVILIGPDGGRTILVHRGATRLETNDIQVRHLEADWFYLASLEGNLDLAQRLITYAKEKEIKVFWNPGKRELKQNKKITPLINKVDIFMVNREEAELVLGIDLDKKGFWPQMKKLGAGKTIVTDGKDGAYIQYSQGVEFLKAPELETVDQTGAGDAFGSGFLAGLLTEGEIKPALESAMDNAASVVQQIGAQTGLIRK